ncbi:hypothetical protein [Aestuariibacter salexigens]|uniref:hypothetical protein n=1 Tax=Aestuariibacter salexigens TaxID=226010 RepID=UPI0006847AE8|nr:hypothetical protein [Aestuariibacter salexigens]
MACQRASEPDSESVQKEQLDPITKSSSDAEGKEQVGMKIITGTIQFKSFEGGFYALDADNGSKYTLRKLDREYQVQGLRVRVTGRVLDDVMTTTQYGDLLDVSKIVVLDDSAITRPADI